MVGLKEITLARLRDQLRERGQRESTTPVGAGLSASARELLTVIVAYGPLCEAMYLMMAADERVLNVEREVLKGAMRELTDGTVKGVHIEALVDTAAKRLAAEGHDARCRAVVETLKTDPVKAEIAFVLAAAIAIADEKLDPREKALLEKMSRGLGIDSRRTTELMRELEREAKAEA